MKVKTKFIESESDPIETIHIIEDYLWTPCQPVNQINGIRVTLGCVEREFEFLWDDISETEHTRTAVVRTPKTEQGL